MASSGEPTDARTRAELLDESLEILQGLWSGEPFEYAGRHSVRADDLSSNTYPEAAHPDLGRRGLATRAVDAASPAVRRHRGPGGSARGRPCHRRIRCPRAPSEGGGRTFR